MTTVKTKKDELYESVLKECGIKLDRRKSLVQMQEQAELVRERAKNPPKEEKIKKPLRCRNIRTGLEMNWHPLYEGNNDLEIIKWHED